MEILHPGPWFRAQSSYYLKPNLSALFQWRTSRPARSVVQLPRFIFMGNQPFFGNGEAMELPAGDAGSRLLMSPPIFWEFGNGDWMCFIPSMSIHWDRNLIIDPYPVAELNRFH